MLNTSFSPWPSYTEEEADAVRQVLASNKTNYRIGGVGRLFEREFASFCGTDHAVALANGTVALDLALRAVGIGPGDEVVVTPRTFFASVSSVVNAGAIPVFADVDLDSQNITPVSVQAVGAKTGDWIEVKEGLKEGEHVVTGANFLIDSESQLKAAVGGMAGMQH